MGIQKFTLFNIKVTADRELTSSENKLLADVLNRPLITREEYLKLSDAKRQPYREACSLAANTLTFEFKDMVLERLSFVASNNVMRETWDRNHGLVIRAFNNYLKDHDQFPSITELSRNTGLSRLTVTKHIREYYSSDQYEERKAGLIVLREQVLAKCYSRAIEGDLKAAKLFMEATANFVGAGDQGHTIRVLIDGKEANKP